MKKISIISNSAFNIYNFRLTLAEEIIKKGYELFFIAPYDEFTSKITQRGFMIKNVSVNPKGSNIIEDKKTIDEFKRIFRVYSPDLILNFTIKPNIYATLAASSLNIPAINTVTGLGTVFIKENFVTDIVEILYKISFSKATKIFFQNYHDRDLFIKKNIVKKECTGIVPGSGVDTIRFFPREKRKNRDKFVFLLIGRMLKDKGLEEYIEAAKIIKKRYDNVEFQLLGSLEVENKTLISKKKMYEWVRNGTVSYLGSTFKVEDYIADADCVVLPSYREGLPKSLLEGASMQKPLIATDVVGCIDVVKDGFNGFLCEAKSSESLAQACEKMLLLDKKSRFLMGENGRKLVLDKFDEKFIIKTYLDEIQKVVPHKLKFRLKYKLA